MPTRSTRRLDRVLGAIRRDSRHSNVQRHGVFIDPNGIYSVSIFGRVAPGRDTINITMGDFMRANVFPVRTGSVVNAAISCARGSYVALMGRTAYEGVFRHGLQCGIGVW